MSTLQKMIRWEEREKELRTELPAALEERERALILHIERDAIMIDSGTEAVWGGAGMPRPAPSADGSYTDSQIARIEVVKLDWMIEEQRNLCIEHSCDEIAHHLHPDGTQTCAAHRIDEQQPKLVSGLLTGHPSSNPLYAAYWHRIGRRAPRGSRKVA